MKRLVHILHPYVAYLILPLFAFTAAGFSLGNMRGDMLGDRRLIGIALGLFLGKQIGVYGAASLAIRLGWAHLPEGTSRLQLYGVCLLCGIGFTMSLFMGALALPEGGELGAKCGKIGGDRRVASVGLRRCNNLVRVAYPSPKRRISLRLLCLTRNTCTLWKQNVR